MFDFSFGELFVVGVVALLVLGPERLPKAARWVGLWVRKARAQWYSVKAEFERELAADEMRRSVGDPARDLRAQAQDTVRALNQALGGEAGATAVPDSPAPADPAPQADGPGPAPHPAGGDPRRDPPA